jgi:hypothetical protein
MVTSDDETLADSTSAVPPVGDFGAIWIACGRPGI